MKSAASGPRFRQAKGRAGAIEIVDRTLTPAGADDAPLSRIVNHICVDNDEQMPADSNIHKIDLCRRIEEQPVSSFRTVSQVRVR